jgi:hypothetical protein
MSADKQVESRFSRMRNLLPFIVETRYSVSLLKQLSFLPTAKQVGSRFSGMRNLLFCHCRDRACPVPTNISGQINLPVISDFALAGCFV